MITQTQLAAIVKCPLPLAARWLTALQDAMAAYHISSPKQIAAFLAQLAHESGHLQVMAENLNYTPNALMATFNTKTNIRFPPDLAFRYGRTVAHPADQKMIASIAYANRLGNGSVASQDGWTYRGQGPIQITGKTNVINCGRAIGIDLQANPAQLQRPDVGSQAAAWFWHEGNRTGKSLNQLADDWDIRGISRAINGGENGMADRVILSAEALKVLS